LDIEGIEITEGKVGARRDIALLAVKGFVDTMTCSILLNKITANLNANRLHIIVDMSQVNYVSSAGWGVFVGEIKGIRERGGDLKIVQMTPEVYDVFEMLEFNRILNYYESLEEAIDDFDISIGLDITRSSSRRYDPASESAGHGVAVAAPVLPAARVSNQAGSAHAVRKPRSIEPHLLPLTEKVKLAVVDDPRRGVFGIKRALKARKYGNTSVNLFKLHSLMRKLNLDTKEKRYRFYRSR